MNFKATVRAVTSSYLGAISSAVTGLMSIRLATHFLSKEEFGLWSFTMQTVGYFLLLDLGVGSSISRLFGEPLSSGDTKKLNSWFTLSLLVLVCQAAIIFGAGLALRSQVLAGFDIPTHLLEQASSLWLSFLVIQAVGLIFKVSFAILHAQNRAYWTNSIQILGAWVGLGAFYWMLNRGWGVRAYAWSSGASVLMVSLGGVWAVLRGEHCFRLSLEGIHRQQVWRLFSFSSSIFVLGLAAQVYFASQGLVATKILGLEAAAVFAVTSRAGAIAMQSICKPFDAFAPRWQVAYCNNDLPRVTREYTLMTRFTILLASAAAIAVALMNQPFVYWWTKPGYFGGQFCSLLLCGFMLVQGVVRCFISPFVLTVQVRAYTVVNLIGICLAICLMIVLTRWIGLAGIPAGLILADLLFPIWFYMSRGGAQLGVDGLRLTAKDSLLWLPLLLLAAVGSLLLEKLVWPSSLLWLISATACTALLTAPLVWKAAGLLRQLRGTSTRDPVSAPVVADAR